MTRCFSSFIATERNLIRSEFMVRFGQTPLVAAGSGLLTWHSDPQKGQRQSAQGYREHTRAQIVKIGPSIYGRPHACFTAAGLGALCIMASDRRALDPTHYGYVLYEFGLSTEEATDFGVREPVVSQGNYSCGRARACGGELTY